MKSAGSLKTEIPGDLLALCAPVRAKSLDDDNDLWLVCIMNFFYAIPSSSAAQEKRTATVRFPPQEVARHLDETADLFKAVRRTFQCIERITLCGKKAIQPTNQPTKKPNKNQTNQTIKQRARTHTHTHNNQTSFKEIQWSKWIFKNIWQ